MLIKEILHDENGDWKFEADITDQQHTFLVNFALNVLLARGAIDPAQLQKIAETEKTGEQGILLS